MENSIANCYLCHAKCTKYPPGGAVDIYDCPFCGVYSISYRLQSEFDEKYISEKHKIAGFLSEINKNNHTKPYILNSDSVKNILSDARIPKTIMQKLEKFLYYCYLEYDYLGQEFVLNESYVNPSLGQDRKNIYKDAKRENISYITKKELSGIIHAMEELHWVKATNMDIVNHVVSFYLTTQGIYTAEKLIQGNKSSSKVFVAIGYHGNYQDKMNTAIFPACKACGFDAFFASDTEHNHNINDEMIVDIKRSKFVISDFTNNNEGAYYEAGYAEGMGLPVIKCCQQDWVPKLHFDVNHDKFIVYKDLVDYNDQLKKRIRATIADAILEDSI
jgi:hypothetical protein